jgi:hypothetical protein
MTTSASSIAVIVMMLTSLIAAPSRAWILSIGSLVSRTRSIDWVDGTGDKICQIARQK